MVTPTNQHLSNMKEACKVQFTKFVGAGSSSNWCSDTYRGGSANSEPEAQAVIDAVAETGDVRSYLSVHSYSQLLLVPHAYAAIKAPDYDELVRLDLGTVVISGMP